jgi:hypothetical protein
MKMHEVITAILNRQGNHNLDHKFLQPVLRKYANAVLLEELEKLYKESIFIDGLIILDRIAELKEKMK